MRLRKTVPFVSIIAAIPLLTVLGCRQQNPEGGNVAVNKTSQAQNPATDSRIPPERRAEIERMMAQQKAAADQMGERMKAAAAQHK